jgi:hypothetical protein
MPESRKSDKMADVHASNGHHAEATLDPEALRVKGDDAAPWAGDETIDYTKLRAPSFIQSPTKKPANPNKVVNRNLHTQEFVRRYECPESTVPFQVIQDKNNRGVTYIVPESLQDLLAKHIVYANFELIMNHEGDLIFVTAQFSDRHGNTNDYWTSKRDILAESTHRWLKLIPDVKAGRYEPDEPVIPIEEPEWPPIDWGALFSVAFKGRVLSTDHRAMRGLVGGKR